MTIAITPPPSAAIRYAYFFIWCPSRLSPATVVRSDWGKCAGLRLAQLLVTLTVRGEWSSAHILALRPRFGAQSLIVAGRERTPHLIGRDDSWRRLSAALERVTPAAGALVLVSGEAGIGKTRLLEEFAAREPDALRGAGRLCRRGAVCALERRPLGGCSTPSGTRHRRTPRLCRTTARPADPVADVRRPDRGNRGGRAATPVRRRRGSAPARRARPPARLRRRRHALDRSREPGPPALRRLQPAPDPDAARRRLPARGQHHRTRPRRAARSPRGGPRRPGPTPRGRGRSRSPRSCSATQPRPPTSTGSRTTPTGTRCSSRNWWRPLDPKASPRRSAT